MLWRHKEGRKYSSTTLDFGSTWSEQSASRPRRFTPEERDPGTLEIRGCVGSRADLDDVEKRNNSCLRLELNPESVAIQTELSRRMIEFTKYNF
jgi:hypothetical protein